MKKPWVIHPVFFALFPFAFLVSHNIGQLFINDREIAAIGGILIVFALVMLGIMSMSLRSVEKAGLVCSLFFFLFFSYGHFFSLIENTGISIGRITLGENKVLFPLWCAFLLGGWVWVARIRRPLYNLTRILNLTGAFLLALSVFPVLSYQVKRTVGISGKNGGDNRPVPVATSLPKPLPDVYYLIFDRYGSARVLKKRYGLDIGEFINFLSNKGFYVAERSRSNYLRTSLSLGSSLNMEYINYLSKEVGEDSGDWTLSYRLMQDFSLWRFFKAQGYTFIHLGSWYEGTKRNPYADINLNIGWLGGLVTLLNQTTMLAPLSEKLGFMDWRHLHSKQINYQFAKLAEIPNHAEPTFVFAHILLPHEPYVFHSDGKIKTASEETLRSREENYRDHILFANVKIKELVEALLSKSDTPPVIILQSDEGPFPNRYFSSGGNFDWTSATPEELEQKLGIFNAYYLPGTNPGLLYPEITPVNSFRVVLNAYFNAGLPLFPDDIYLFKDERHPYKFIKMPFSPSQENIPLPAVSPAH